MKKPSAETDPLLEKKNRARTIKLNADGYDGE